MFYHCQPEVQGQRSADGAACGASPAPAAEVALSISCVHAHVCAIAFWCPGAFFPYSKFRPALRSQCSSSLQLFPRQLTHKPARNCKMPLCRRLEGAQWPGCKWGCWCERLGRQGSADAPASFGNPLWPERGVASVHLLLSCQASLRTAELVSLGMGNMHTCESV